ncbi:DNA ligase 1 isoform X1 [Benincasa hispida]|uniref:DNA ligase 1 isoform X1 n=1 Tax=Benincasa hispida TaxID=102211 RepID=UPI001900EF7B|nr:DNA ligase 1 isoform X1 [Benincasa hispida]
MGNMKTPTTKARVRKRVSDTDLTSSDQRKRTNDDLDLDLDLSDDLKGIVSALNQIKERAHKDDQKKNEETISSVATEMRTMIEQVKSKLEKDRQNFAKALSKSSKECENCLKDETAKFRALYEKFTKEKATHLQAIKDTISKFEEEKERLFVKYEQLRKRERSLISEQEKACAEKIAQLEESLKRKKQDDKTFSLLRKTLGSFLETGSDEDFPADD